MFIEIALIQRLMTYLGNPTYALVAVLFVLLAAGGTGSALLGRASRDGARRGLFLAMVGIVAYGLVASISLGAVFESVRGAPGTTRALLAASLLVPLGLLLGMPLPTALRAVAARAPTRVPWLWAVNGATSVLGSVLATLVSLNAGIPTTLRVGAALYAVALGLWVPVGRSQMERTADR